MDIIQPIKLLLDAEPPFYTLIMRQGDSARIIEATIYEGSVRWTIPDGATAQFRAAKPDGTNVVRDAEIASNMVTVNVTANTLAVAGAVNCEIVFSDAGGDVLGTTQFVIDVWPAAVSDTEIQSQDDYQSLIQAVTDAQAAAAEAEAARDQYPQISAATTNWTTYDPEAGEYQDTGYPSRGPAGPQGEPGTDIQVLGLYATLAALQAAHPTGSAGDVYAVGTSTSNFIYIWDVDSAAWVNVGALMGPQGPQGPQGDPTRVNGRPAVLGNIQLSALDVGAASIYEQIDGTKTASFSIDATALGKTYLLANAADITVTIPANDSLPVGFGFFIRSIGTGAVLISPGSTAVLLNGESANVEMLDDYAGIVAVVKIAANSWALNGAIQSTMPTVAGASPLVAATAAAMTDTTKVYVYVGSEAGYTSGNWYYYNGSAWTSGGVYNAAAVQTDKTLTVENEAADAKATGAAISTVQGSIEAVAADLYGAYVTEAASGSTASFSDGADSIPLASLTAAIEPVQSGSGDPSPSNVRPITGWTEANIISSPTGIAQDGTTYTIDFADAGTVYRGSLNVLTGVLTVPYGGVDLGSLTWGYGSDYFTGNLVGIQRLPNAQTVADVICSIFIPGTPANVIGGGSTNNYKISLGVSGDQVFVRDSDYTDAAAFKTAMAGQMLVYPLATPLTYQLTPAQVESLFGTNNIWADTGNVNLIYRADTRLFIEKMLNA